MQRFFVPADSIQDGQVILPEAQARQIRTVLRLHSGQRIQVLDNSGDVYDVELTAVHRDMVRGRILGKTNESREPRTGLIIYQSLLKAEKFEWVLQKCTEIGVREFVPVIAERSVSRTVSHARSTRWQRVLAEAAEQSGQSKIPLLHPVQAYEKALRQAEARGSQMLIPWEGERLNDLRGSLQPVGDVQLFVGPEGGWTESEIDLARSVGAKPITLGQRILRAETAGLVASAAIFFARGELDALGPSSLDN